MAEKLIIEGGKPLKGEVEITGCKNAATPILAATLLTRDPCIIDNLPLIEDVFKMIKLIEGLGAKIKWLGKRKIKVQAENISASKLNQDLVSQMRSSVLLIGPLLARLGEVRISQPGGCIIGARPIDVHLEAFRKMGVEVTREQNFYRLRVRPSGLVGGNIILGEFSVTATENILMASALIPEKTTIKIAACEPHVQDLALFLKKMGAKIKGEGTHTIEVRGQKRLKGAKHFLIYDPIEAGTFIIAALTTKGEVLIKNAPIWHMDLFLEKLREFGAKFKIRGTSIRIEPWEELKIDKIQAMPYPGIPTDLQSALGVLATQTKGSTLIHDPLYEGRLKYLEELNKMGAEIFFADPHRAIINGPTQLYGRELMTLDLRGGAALILAGLVAKGKTIINNVSQIDRGYEQIEKKLQKLGADIRRIQV